MKNEVQEISDEIKSNLLKNCWYVSTGGSAGTTFKLILGGKVLRNELLKNPAHSYEYQRFEGEVSLLVWCSWRLEKDGNVITGRDDETEKATRILGELADRQIIEVQVDYPGWDLHLLFSGGYRLNIFCDLIHKEEDLNLGNWELFLSEKIIAIHAGAKCEILSRS
jgi:hypothetical protein